MRWMSALSLAATADLAVDEVVRALRAQGAGPQVDLLFVFATATHGLAGDAVPRALRAAFPGARLVGCSASGVVGGGREVEDGAALSVVAASLPGVVVHPFWLSEASLDADVTAAVTDATPVDPDADPAVVLLADPFTCPVEPVIDALDERFPRASVLGALASGGREPGTTLLYVDDRAVHDGAVGVAMVGDLVMDVLVAQGCRPVGGALRVSDARGPVVRGLDGEPALPRLREAVDALPEDERRLFSQAPMIGLATDAGGGPPARGDWLVRQILGVDPRREAFAVGHTLEDGDLLHLHVRDPLASVEDLAEVAARWARAHPEGAAGVLLFTCLGRGEGFYGRPDIDSRTIAEQLGPLEIGGFFGQGEIGPVRARTHLHGHTAAVGLFRAPAWN